MASSKRFTILTANLRGIATVSKRTKAFTILISKKAQIYLLTETHIETLEQVKEAENDWIKAGGVEVFLVIPIDVTLAGLLYFSVQIAKIG